MKKYFISIFLLVFLAEYALASDLIPINSALPVSIKSDTEILKTRGKQEISSQIENKYLTKSFKFGIYVEPLGFLQFGPKAGIEMTIISRIVIDHHIRFTAFGMLMPVVLEEEDGKPEELEGMAFSAGIKYLNPSGIGGFYIGIQGEVGKTRTLFLKNEEDEWRGEAIQIASYISLGYKFEFSSGFFIRTGGYIGCVCIFDNRWYYTRDRNNVFINEKLFLPGGMLEASFGFQF